MSSKKEEVALVVQRGYLASTELGEGGEELGKHASDRVTQKRCEAVEDEFRGVGSWTSMTLVISTVTSGHARRSPFRAGHSSA